MAMRKMVNFTDQKVDFFHRLSIIAECKAAILWARRQLRYAFSPLGIELRECYLCGSSRWRCTYERHTDKVAKVVARNVKGELREAAHELLHSGQNINEYIDELSTRFPDYSEFLSKVKYSDMDATIVPYKDGLVWSRYNLDQSMRKLLDDVNSEVDMRFNLSPSYSAIEIGYPALRHKCTNILLIPVFPSPRLLFMREICTPVKVFVNQLKLNGGIECLQQTR